MWSVLVYVCYLMRDNLYEIVASVVALRLALHTDFVSEMTCWRVS